MKECKEKHVVAGFSLDYVFVDEDKIVEADEECDCQEVRVEQFGYFEG